MNTRVLAAQSAAFQQANGRWPSPMATSKAESLAGRWLEQQRGDAARGQLPASARAILDGVAPGWESSDDGSWEGYARELSTFILAERRAPSVMSVEGSREHALALWALSHRHLAATGRLAPTRGHWLSSHCPGWDGSLDIPVTV